MRGQYIAGSVRPTKQRLGPFMVIPVTAIEAIELPVGCRQVPPVIFQMALVQEHRVLNQRVITATKNPPNGRIFLFVQFL